MRNFIKTDGNDKVLELHLTVLVFEEESFYVSYCPSLNLSSYGDSIQDAKDGFDEVVRAYLEECGRNGTLPADLRKHGWKFKSSVREQKAEPPAMVNVNIPAGVLKRQFNENWKVSV